MADFTTGIFLFKAIYGKTGCFALNRTYHQSIENQLLLKKTKENTGKAMKCKILLQVLHHPSPQ